MKNQKFHHAVNIIYFSFIAFGITYFMCFIHGILKGLFAGFLIIVIWLIIDLSRNKNDRLILYDDKLR